MSKTLTVDLDRNYSYQTGGGVADFNHVTLASPCGDQNLICAKLEQGFYRAQIDVQEFNKRLRPEAYDEAVNKASESDSEIDLPEQEQEIEINAATVKAVLFMSERVDAAEYLDLFRSLVLKKGVCLCGDAEPLTQKLWSDLDYVDQRKIMTEYISYFLL